MAKARNKFTIEMLIDSSFLKKEVPFVNFKDTSLLVFTLEYFIVVNKIIDHYVENTIDIIKDEAQKIDLIEYKFSKRFMEPDSLEDFKEKSFFGKVSSIISSFSYEIKILKIDSAIELIEKHFQLEDSHEKVVDDFLKNHPEYRRAKDEFDRLENEKVRKINQINSFVTILDKFR